MNHKLKFALIVVFTIGVIVGAFAFFRHLDIAVLMPAGVVAAKERNLMLAVTLLTLIVVVPVFVLLIYIAWTYRESNTAAKYEPEWTNPRLEIIWWGIPFAIIAALSVIIWQSSHSLDPYKPLVSTVKPMTIQVVALQWKWLFIYPEQNIATVNQVEFPAGTPVNFEITGDAPMNSFWIPRLGGQIYAMSGMRTNLSLLADAPGVFAGSSANLSGAGFAGMKFQARAVPPVEFDQWTAAAKASPIVLDREHYLALAAPSSNNPPAVYASPEYNLFDKIITSYMAPASDSVEGSAK
ncbi:MAG: ubiquinol oxidase subunit II [Candidatus Saccharimonadales bacterium]